MQKEKNRILSEIVFNDFKEGNEERLVRVDAQDENSFILTFKADEESKLKGIKLKAGYQFNAETKTYDKVNDQEGDLFGTHEFFKVLSVKMTGAKRGKTLLEVNAKMREIMEGEHKAADKANTDEPGVYAEVPSAVMDGEDKGGTESAEEKDEAKEVVADAQGFNGVSVIMPTADNEEKAEESVESEKVESEEVKDDVVTEEDFSKAVSEAEAQRHAFIDFYGEVGMLGSVIVLVSTMFLTVRTMAHFKEFLELHVTEETSEAIQRLMRMGLIDFSESYNEEFFAFVKSKGFKVLSEEEVVSCEGKSELEIIKDRAEKEEAESEKGEVGEEKVSVEQKPNHEDLRNFEDEDHEGIYVPRREPTLKEKLNTCRGFLPRSKTSVTPEGFCNDWE